MIRRLRDYYRQFEELSPDEISRELRERRDAERARELSEVPPLDLASASWHQPPDAEAVNAATYALRRGVNAYPDDAPLREALARRHGVEPAQVAPGHGAGELLHAAFRAIAAGRRGRDRVAGLGPAPEARARGGRDAGPRRRPTSTRSRPRDAGAVVLCSPNDPTGVAIPPADLQAFARDLDESAWLVVDAALAEFAPDELDAAALLAARERVLVVRSFSKAHAMAGFRAGYALAARRGPARPPDAGGRRVGARAGGDAVGHRPGGGGREAAPRGGGARAGAARGAALQGTPFSFPAGHGPLVWLDSASTAARPSRATSPASGSSSPRARPGATTATCA